MIRVLMTSLFGGAWFPVLAVALIAGAFGTGYLKGRASASHKAHIGRLELRNQQLNADRNRLARQVASAGEALEEINRRSVADAEILEDLETRLETHERELEKARSDDGQCEADNRFILGADDIERLRKLR